MPTAAPRTPEHALSVGRRLRLAREALGLGIGDIVSRTRLSHRIVEAIELGDYSVLRSRIFAIGSVRGYARALDLDEHALASDLEDEIEPLWPQTSPLPAPRRARRTFWGKMGFITQTGA